MDNFLERNQFLDENITIEQQKKLQKELRILQSDLKVVQPHNDRRVSKKPKSSEIPDDAYYYSTKSILKAKQRMSSSPHKSIKRRILSEREKIAIQVLRELRCKIQIFSQWQKKHRRKKKYFFVFFQITR